jgi:two-component system chemotaxis sensor kinase CheA
MEDIFYYLREESPKDVDYSEITDNVFSCMDFIKDELDKIRVGEPADGDGSELIEEMKDYLENLKGETQPSESRGIEKQSSSIGDIGRAPESPDDKRYRCFLKFDESAEMENVRAYNIVYGARNVIRDVSFDPDNPLDERTADVIRERGFRFEFFSAAPMDELRGLIKKAAYISEMDLSLAAEGAGDISSANAEKNNGKTPGGKPKADGGKPKSPTAQRVISVNVSKLDRLLNLMGELVIAEAMVTQNPELGSLELDSFYKEAMHLHKIINDVQDTVMSMRMAPLSGTFFKMRRIVRDMCKQLKKDVALEIIGEETEVDKNIIDHIADPLMHIIRNSIDHGIETPDKRAALGKPERGVVTLEARNSGGDVLITVRDDGAGLNKEKILDKAKANGLLRKAEADYTDKEIYQFIFLPGFSTGENVTAYSGRGVGMDVVSTNLSVMGGSAFVDSAPGRWSEIVLKIPLTLAIIEGMTVRMGRAKYTIPIVSIKQSFKANREDLLTDPSGNEMILARGEVYNLIRLYEFFGVSADMTDPTEGIIIIIENSGQTVCIMADELIGQRQVVVKSMPKYIKKIPGISGCALLGNGDISFIIDIAGFFDKGA